MSDWIAVVDDDRTILRKQNGLIKIITGARRNGKSYLLNELYYRYLLGNGVSTFQIIRFAFDSDEDLDLLEGYFPDEPTRIQQKNGSYLVNAKKFRAYIQEKTNEADEFYLLLDEVQMLEHFVGTLNGLLRHQNFDIYVTGSNSRFLSSDIVTEFKGRGTQVHVLPLAFSEYVDGLGLSVDEAWRSYIETGGIPLVALMNTEEEKTGYLKDLCEEVYLKDIVQHNGVRKTTELADMFDVLASMTGSLVNPMNLANTFLSVTHKKITDDTVANFIGYFEDAFLVCKAKKYNVKGKRYIGSPYKLYFEDIGIRNARLNFRQMEESHIMENIIFNELRYRGFHVDVGEVDVSEKTERVDVNGKRIYAKKSLEVDFIAAAGSQKYYIQSALSISDLKKEQQEKRSLYYIGDTFKKIVVTKNGLNPYRDENGVVVMDVFDFLMDEGSLEG